MPVTDSNVRTIPQLSQLDIKFCGPLWADQQVDTVADLQNITNLYIQKLVWVRAENTWYYCKDPFATKIDEYGNSVRYPKWEKQDSRSTITVYDLGKGYLKGEAVFLAGKIYSALMDINPGEAPTDTYDEPKWLCISGNTLHEFIPFENQSIISFATKISAPFFDVWLLLDTESGIPEKVFVPVEQIDEHNYQIHFYEDNELAPQTGFINIK